MRRLLEENGLSLVMFGLFGLFLAGQALAGHRQDNEERRRHGETATSLGSYLRSGEFIEATFENWESEFLQMGCFVLFAGVLRQKGSGESKSFEPEADDSEGAARPDSPWPTRKGGVALRLYSHSLSAALLFLFALSFALHAWGGTLHHNREAARAGENAVGLIAFMGSAEFWFQSFQNWQSEFLSVATLVVFSIFLRERGSPESKPLRAPHSQTGR